MTLLEVSHLTKTFRGRPPIPAVNDISFCLDAGQTLGIVGESGSGKSTLIRCLVRLEKPDAGGSIVYDGLDIAKADRHERARLSREVQLVFQDPDTCLNPRMTLEQLVGEGLVVHKMTRTASALRDRVQELLTRVGLGSVDVGRYPQSFSGGQRQRIAIARALAVEPRLLVCDEPVSRLDVSVRAQVMNLLKDMQTELDLTVVFVSHDLATVRYLCTDLLVMTGGTAVEEGRTEEVLADPQHEYTRELLASSRVTSAQLEKYRRAGSHAARPQQFLEV